MAGRSYLAKCVFPSSVLHTGRAWEARCTAAAGAETENGTGGQASHQGPSAVTENQPRTRQSPASAGEQAGAALPSTLDPPPFSSVPVPHHYVRTEDTRWPVQREKDKEATINMNTSIYNLFSNTLAKLPMPLFNRIKVYV